MASRYEEIKQLIFDHLAGNLTPQEDEHLRQWCMEDPENEQFLESLEV